MKCLAWIAMAFLASPAFSGPSEVTVANRERLDRAGLVKTTYKQFWGGYEILDATRTLIADQQGNTVADYDFTVPTSGDPPFHPNKPDKDACLRAIGAENRKIKNLSLKSVYYSDNGSIVPIYHLVATFETDQIEAAIDAVTGKVILARSNKWDADGPRFFVFPKESPLPADKTTKFDEDYEPSYDEQQVIDGFGQSDESPLGWISGLTTSGNNSIAADDKGNLGIMTGPGIFSNTFDPLLDPDDQINLSIYNVFYEANLFHDYFYKMGFNELAGNYQIDNFGRGGIGGDPLNIAVYTGKDVVNNAGFMGYFPDGGYAQVVFFPFVGDYLPVARHSAMDRHVVRHELTHALHVRLVPIFFKFTAQPYGMGEGWADTISYIRNAKPGQDFAQPLGLGAYVSRAVTKHNYYFGFRRYPYSTDQKINPLTLGWMNPDWFSYQPGYEGPPKSDVAQLEDIESHSIGEIWCSMHIDFFSKMVARYGLEKGRERTLQVMVDGMKLTASTPTFIDARTGLLLAEKYSFGDEDRILIWNAFAGRGFGTEATVPIHRYYYPVTESYKVPDWSDFNQDGKKDINDFIAFREAFIAKKWSADINADNKLNVNDFIAFQKLFRE